MPVTKPTILPDWASSTIGAARTLAPPGTEVVDGWPAGYRPPAQHLNYLLSNTASWLKWLQDINEQAFTWTQPQAFSGGLSMASGTSPAYASLANNHANSTLLLNNAGSGLALHVQTGAAVFDHAVTSGFLTLTNGAYITSGGIGVTGDIVGLNNLNLSGEMISNPVINYLSLVFGSTPSGGRRVVYWRDASSAVHVEGTISFPGGIVGNAGGYMVLVPGTFPSYCCPTDHVSVPAMAQSTGTNNYIPGFVRIYSNGQMVVTAGPASFDLIDFSFVYHPSVSSA